APLNRYVFHVRASYYDETEKIVEQVVSTGGKKIAVFYQNDAYGEAGRKGTEMALTKRSMKIHANGTVERNTLKVEEAVKTINAMEGFLTAKVMVEGLRRAGKNPTREGLVDALEKMQDVDIGGFYVSYSPKNHAGSRFVDLTIIGRNGKFLR